MSNAARYFIRPEGAVKTAWPGIVAVSTHIGVIYRPWQAEIGRDIMAKLPDGTFAASEGGCVLCIPRQTGKTYLVVGIVIAYCLANPDTEVIWTAHLLSTAREAFRTMLGITSRETCAPFMLRPTLAVGQEAINFANGSRIRIGSRQRGFGRGLSGINVLVFDEAQILTQATLDDTLASMNRGETPWFILMGTPPKPTDTSEVFAEKRREALAGESSDMLYVEYSADQDADLDDREQWAIANPSYPHDTPDAAIRRLRRNLPGNSFRREALGIWDQVGVRSPVIPTTVWNKRRTQEPAPAGVMCYGVKFTLDAEHVALSVAVKPNGGPVFVETLQEAPTAQGLKWLVDWITERADKLSLVAIDGKAGTQLLANALIQAGVNQRLVRIMSVDDVIAAHALFLDATAQGRITHAGQQGLVDQVEHAGKRSIGTRGGWGFTPINGQNHLAPLDSVVLAHWAAATSKPKRPSNRKAQFA